MNCPICDDFIEVPDDTEIVVCPKCHIPIAVNESD